MVTAQRNRANNSVASPAFSNRSARLQEIICEPLPSFDARNLEAVQCAFRSAASCSFGQAWLGHEEPDFAPGVVRLGWRDSALLVFAELTDADLFNSATALNQRAWELGDVFEIFLRAAESDGYIELQVTPNNHRLQLQYRSAADVQLARKAGALGDFLIWSNAFHSRTWISDKGWNIYAEIPALSVPGADERPENTQWRFSFGRYDYTRGRKEPVISSTSPHGAPDFHRQQEWGVITFKRRAALQTNGV